MEETPSILSHSQRYAAAALFALAVNQSQIHQGRTPVTPRGGGGDAPGIADPASVSDKPDLWIHENSGLLWPVFRYSIYRNQVNDAGILICALFFFLKKKTNNKVK